VDAVEFSRRPTLDRPTVVTAFRGWNDAGEAASGALDLLRQRWRAEPFATIDPEEFYDFQVNRPTVRLMDGVTRTIEWPESVFAHASPEGRDVVLFSSTEPNNRWRGFASTVIDVARDLGADRLVTLGAFLADVPHTRPVPIAGSASDPEEAERLGLSTSRYEGPTGIVGVLHDLSNRSGLPSLSLWAATPHYAPSGPNPKATGALVAGVSTLLDVKVDPGDLPDAAQTWESALSEAVKENEPLSEYVRRLEQAYEPELGISLRTGESLAAEVERFLREQGGDPNGD
jgi:predicted ATP-grasp superfamily ATP-dependent carboligase